MIDNYYHSYMADFYEMIMDDGKIDLEVINNSNIKFCMFHNDRNMIKLFLKYLLQIYTHILYFVRTEEEYEK